ncbi:Succinyl-CoA ligase [ADP-forming] alpha chain [hydrothermal vent metagenome]|uniref:Succinyl-CoA ligase [ADP-forming] alpha chain n=1 Tax=hydrothermal vent metagenome TaxID=652676 RepID=A0A3B0S606_9ZZZZ
MSILIDKNTRVITQGVTSNIGLFQQALMLEFVVTPTQVGAQSGEAICLG